MVVGEGVPVLALRIFGRDGTDGVEDIAVGAVLDNELLCVLFVCSLPLEIDGIALRGAGELKEGEG